MAHFLRTDLLLLALPVALLHAPPPAAARGQQIIDSADGSELKLADQQNSDEPGSERVDPPDDTRTIEDIYRDVFGRDRPTSPEDDYPVLIDGVNVGTARIRPGSAGQDGTIDPTFVHDILAPLVIGEAGAALEKIGEQPSVSFAELDATGLEIQFDAGNLALLIGIPVAMRGIRTLNLRASRNRQDLTFVEPAGFSAYTSVRTGIAFVEHSDRTDTGFDRLVADIDLAANIHGFVLEGDLRYDERRRHKWSRGDVRLTHDIVDKLIRLEAGDLSIGRRPYQASPRIAGVAAFREFGIDPYRNIRPVPDQLFELQEPARVEVLINGVPSRNFDLPSGRFSLRDFPLVPSAANDVELRITYASGRTELVSFPAFFDLDLLQQGLFDFAFNLGFPYEDADGIRRYDTGTYNGLGYARYGFSNTVTAGIGFQGDNRFQQGAIDFVWASPFGTFGINAATDLGSPGVDTGQLTVQYRWRDADRLRNRNVDALINLTGKDYRTLDRIFGGNLVEIQARGRAGQNIGPHGSAQIFAGYEKLRGGLGESWFVGGNYTHQFRFGSVSAGMEYRNAQERGGLEFQLALAIPLGGGSVNGSYSSQGNAARIDYTRFAPAGVGALGFRASAERRDGSDRQLVQATYIGNRFEASLAQRAENYFNGSGRRDLRSEITFGTALVMAGGHFGLSRPVRNGFAIIAPQAGASEYQIAVEPRTGFGSNDRRYSAFSGALGPAVVPQLPAYLNRSLQVDAPDAPAGISLGGQVFSIRPAYRSGYYLPVGDDGNVTIVGKLVDREGNPVAYAIGTAVERGAKGEEPQQVFTNAAGRFLVEGAKAGQTYRLALDVEGQTMTVDIEIPEDTSGIYRVEEPLTAAPAVPAVAAEKEEKAP